MADSIHPQNLPAGYDAYLGYVDGQWPTAAALKAIFPGKPLSGLGIARSEVRLVSAHYDAGEHICGPSTCKLISVAMDGTQWTDKANGVGGTQIDASVLQDEFLVAPPTVPAWQEEMVKALPVVKQGDKSQYVRNVQGLLCAHGHTVTIGGNFGPLTESALRAWQTQ
jgi:peptidoglycan hydrolase-like protein with peptidoglycan-binding domain